MMLLKLLSLLLLSSCVLALDTNGSHQAIDSFELVSNPCQELRRGGFICVDCATLGFCVNTNDQWQTVAMTECDAQRGFYCSDEVSIGCTWQPHCQVPVRGKFSCQLPGIYPDPYDCRSYHVCDARNEDTPQQCTNGAAYSLLTNSCSLPRDVEQCTEKQYSCSFVGEMGVWAPNASYYYVCQQEHQGEQDIFYPLMFRCQAGYVFNGNRCEQQRQALFQSRASDDSAVEDCVNGQLYPAATPAGFYLCHNGQMDYFSCPVGSYYDSVISVCRHGQPPSDALLCGDVGAETPATPAICERWGLAADLSNCNRYYHCESAGSRMLHEYCPINYIFDLTRFTCVPGAC